MNGPSATQPDALVIGIDIGGTKTHIRAARVAGGGARDQIRPTDDWRRRDWNADAARILGMATALADGAPIVALGVGAHGCDDADECLALEAALTTLTPITLAVVNDAELMPLAIGLGGQIGIVAGTGSIAVCRPAAGEMMVAGGWGWIIGDEGGAASLVREAMRAVSHHFDAGGGRGEPLVEAMFEALAVPSIPRLGTALGALGPAAAVGGHAMAVFDAAERGSELAARVIREGGQALARLAALLDRRGAGAAHAVAGGSVIVSQPALWRAFVDALAETCPTLAPHLFNGDPVEGACRLAASLADPRVELAARPANSRH